MASEACETIKSLLKVVQFGGWWTSSSAANVRRPMPVICKHYLGCCPSREPRPADLHPRTRRLLSRTRPSLALVRRTPTTAMSRTASSSRPQPPKPAETNGKARGADDVVRTKILLLGMRRQVRHLPQCDVNWSDSVQERQDVHPSGPVQRPLPPRDPLPRNHDAPN